MTEGRSGAAVEVDGLRVEDRNGRAILRDISFSLANGERLGIVGESGAGKTTLALALLGHFRPGLRHSGGSIQVAGRRVHSSSQRQLRDYRRTVISYLGQDPTGALTPSQRVGDQVRELMQGSTSSDAVREHLKAVGLPGETEFARRYPHELSGGQLQRVAIARALAPNPSVLVLDEPTASLDLITRQVILQEIERQVELRGITLIVISHDLAMVAQMADEVLVLRDGEAVEQGSVASTLSDPCHHYTRELVALCGGTQRSIARNGMGEPSQPSALTARGLVASYGRGKERTRVVDGVDLDLAAGECVALIGMSGAGKSTIAWCLLGLHEPDSGRVAVAGNELAPRVQNRPMAARRTIQLVPQDPQGSLNHRRRVGDILRHALRSMRGLSRMEAEEQARILMERVRLSPDLLSRYPRELSGGEIQRIAIARALAAEPSVLICDEITSSLDVSVEASILDLIDELRQESGLAVLLIAHDLRVVRRVADRAVVLHDGVVWEQGTASSVLLAPEQDLTRSILSADQPLAEILRRRLGEEQPTAEASGRPTP